MAQRATPQDVGVWVDGRFGDHMANLFLFSLARDRGWNPGGDIEINDEQSEYEWALEAEEWLNENVAPDGYLFGWHNGDFGLWHEKNWDI